MIPPLPNQGLDTIPVIEEIRIRCVKPDPSRWPPEIAAEMERIRNTPDPLEIDR